MMRKLAPSRLTQVFRKVDWMSKANTTINLSTYFISLFHMHTCIHKICIHSDKDWNGSFKLIKFLSNNKCGQNGHTKSSNNMSSKVIFYLLYISIKSSHGPHFKKTNQRTWTKRRLSTANGIAWCQLEEGLDFKLLSYPI